MDIKLKSILDYTNKELDILNIRDKNLRNSIDNILSDLYKFSQGEEKYIQFLLQSLIKCTDKKPISPLTEYDFKLTNIKRSNNRSYQYYTCSRYPQVYMDLDYKIWDTRSVAFKFLDSSNSEKVFLYTNKYNSIRQVDLPYYPCQEIKLIQKTKKQAMEEG